jgi:adenosylcobinamide kinase / adenosylcobinamide-phosphate guanylyltransferase
VGNEITLVLGGARSGKSETAEKLALRFGTPVTYVATGIAEQGDADWVERIRRHRERRPVGWMTLEVGPKEDLGTAIRAITGPALIDSLGTWVAGLPAFGADGPQYAALCEGLAARRGAGLPTVVVSEEVGLGVHPSSTAGRLFRDALGSLNRLVADSADSVLLVVAGRVLTLGPGVP